MPSAVLAWGKALAEAPGSAASNWRRQVVLEVTGAEAPRRPDGFSVPVGWGGVDREYTYQATPKAHRVMKVGMVQKKGRHLGVTGFPDPGVACS